MVVLRKQRGHLKCPSDQSTVKFNGVTYPRVRSMAMNAWFNSTDVEGFGSGFRVYKNMSDLVDRDRPGLGCSSMSGKTASMTPRWSWA